MPSGRCGRLLVVRSSVFSWVRLSNTPSGNSAPIQVVVTDVQRLQLREVVEYAVGQFGQVVVPQIQLLQSVEIVEYAFGQLGKVVFPQIQTCDVGEPPEVPGSESRYILVVYVQRAFNVLQVGGGHFRTIPYVGDLPEDGSFALPGSDCTQRRHGSSRSRHCCPHPSCRRSQSAGWRVPRCQNRWRPECPTHPPSACLPPGPSHLLRADRPPATSLLVHWPGRWEGPDRTGRTKIGMAQSPVE